MKSLMLFLFLFVTALSNAQCVQCGGSRVDVSFTTATFIDTNGVESVIAADYQFILDFKNSKFKYFKDGVLQYTRTMQYYGIIKDNKHFCVSWNSEKNPGVKPDQIIVNINDHSFVYKCNILLDTPETISTNSAVFTSYK